MKKLFIILMVTGISVNAYSNPLETGVLYIASIFSGTVSESLVKNMNGGKSHDAIKKNYLEAIKMGILELEKMNDPKIDEIYAFVNERLKDNDLSMLDYNLISNKIVEHKRAINSKNSRHAADTAEFRKSLPNAR